MSEVLYLVIYYTTYREPYIRDEDKLYMQFTNHMGIPSL